MSRTGSPLAEQPGDAGNPRSLVDAVTTRLRAAILSGRISPGERIRCRVLEEEYGVSHIPIREALRRLEGEGLVENVPQRGASAARLSIRQFRDVYDLRKILEPAVAVRALERMTDARLERIAAVLEGMRQVEDTWHSPEFSPLHREWHWLAYEPGSNTVIERTLRQLWQTADRYVALAQTVGGAAPQAIVQHERLYEILKRGDREELGREVYEHLANTERGMERVIRAALEEPEGALRSMMADVGD